MPRNYGITNVQSGTSAPSGALTADIYYNTVVKHLYIYDGGNWLPRDVPLGGAVGTRLAKNSGLDGDWDWLADNGWLPQPSTATYFTTLSFTVNADVRALVDPGTMLKIVQGATTIYAYVNTITWSSPNSTITIVGTANLANATIDSWSIAYECPPDFPAAMSWTPTFTGFSTAPSGLGDSFVVINGWCFYTARHVTAGTSNGTGFTFTLPIRAIAVWTNGRWTGSASCTDNSVELTGSSTLSVLTNGTTCTAYKTADATNAASWTASGSKRINCGTIIYPVHA